MKNHILIDLLNQKHKLYFVNALRQIWSNNKYSYLKSPRPNNGLLLVIDGCIEYKFCNGSFKAVKGDLVFLPQNSYYEAYFHSNNQAVISLLINFTHNENEEFFDSIKTPMLIFGNADSKFGLLFDDAISAHNAGDDSYYLANSYFFMLLHNIQQSLKNQIYGKEYEIIQKAKELLGSSNKISIKEIAAECLTNESNLRRIFKRQVGVSPNNYRLDVKIKSAKRMLISTDMSIKEIAYGLGFFDEAYFHKTFSKKVGMTPKEFRIHNES